jgi:hypothetical protein
MPGVREGAICAAARAHYQAHEREGIRLTKEREIAAYVWVHSDDDR